VAINVKKLKRVIQGNEPLKVLNAGDKKPAFRQNGYGLTFDAANNDDLIADLSNLVIDHSALNFEATFDKKVNSTSGVLLSIGSYNTLGTAGFYLRTTGSGWNLSFSNQSQILFSKSGALSVGKHTIKVQGLSIYVDDVLFTTTNDLGVLDFNTSPLTVGKLAGSGGTFRLDTTVYNFNFNNETFSLEESRGTTITGSDGTIATINTSNAGGVQYLDSTVWNKKSFVLGLDSANSEYLSLDKTIGSEESITINVDVEVGGSNVTFVASGTFADYMGVLADGRLFVQKNSVFQTATLVSISSGVNTITYRRSGGSNYISANGGTEQELANLGDEDFTVTYVGRYTSTYASFTIHDLSIADEKFNLTEGLGNEVFGDKYDGQYKNVLDNANSDYLQTENISITKISDVHFKQKLDIDLSNTAVGSILSFGISGNYFYLNVNTSNIISIDGRDDLGNSFFTSGSVINGTELIEFDGVRLYVDGVLDVDLSSFGEIPFVTNSPFFLGRLAYQTSRYYTGSISSFELQDETFSLNEPSGATFTGSNGTTGTRNTAHADGTDYINDSMIKGDGWSKGTIHTSNAQGIERTNYGQWLKNGNILKLDSVNSDYLEFDTQFLVSGDFTLSVDLVSNISANTQVLFSTSSTNVSLFGGGKIYWQTETDAYYLSTTGILPITGAYVFGIERIGNDTFFYVDSVLVDTISGYNGDIGFLWIGWRSTSYFEGVIKNFSINSENFQFREGQGITTTGSLGTTATINTSNAGGVQYINEQVWNIDSNKYIDYE
jgi:hypothetical protein